MNLRDVLSTRSAFGVARVALVVAALAGFLAMHGFAMTDGAGSHHAAAVASPHTAAVAAPHTAPPGLTHSGPASADVTSAVTSTVTSAVTSRDSEDRPLHESVMAGCLLVLLALTGALMLQLGWATSGLAVLRAAVRTVPRPASARAPPCPIFLSLCVFRL